MNINKQPKRILLKISGEALAKGSDFTFNFDKVREICDVISRCAKTGVQVAVVCGAGNIWRGRQAEKKMDRVRADYMGMFATCINALCIVDFLNQVDTPAVALSAVASQPEYIEGYTKEKAVRYLEEGKVVVFAGGTGNPCFSTDTGAVLRAVEIEADRVLFAKAVSHIYNRDPRDESSTLPLYKYEYLSFKDILAQDLTAIDTTATAFCLANDLPIYVFGLDDPENILRAAAGEVVGTIVYGGQSKILEE